MSWLGDAVDFAGDFVSGAWEKVGGVVSDALSNVAGIIVGDRYGRAAEDRAFDKQQLAWQRQNEYNTPQAQMARLRTAGINPHMAYMRGTINNVASGMSPVASHAAKPKKMWDMETYQRVSNLKKTGNVLDAQEKSAVQDVIAKAIENKYRVYERNELMKYGMIKNESLPMFITRMVNQAVRSKKINSKDAIDALFNLLPLVVGGAGAGSVLRGVTRGRALKKGVGLFKRR